MTDYEEDAWSKFKVNQNGQFINRTAIHKLQHSSCWQSSSEAPPVDFDLFRF